MEFFLFRLSFSRQATINGSLRAQLLLTELNVIDSMHLSLSYEANSSSAASQHFMEPEVHYRDQKSPQLVATLSQSKPLNLLFVINQL
jgi:hypothetical protein